VSSTAPPVLPRLRSLLDDLPAYRPGRPAALGDAGKLSANENPHPPLPSVLDAVAAAAASLNRYPDPACGAITQALAERHDVGIEQIAVGAGSVALCQQLVFATAGPGDEVLFAWRSFEAYPIVTRMGDATPRQVPLTAGGEHDLDAMGAAIGPATRLVFVCNPNNPTGRIVDAARLATFVGAVPADVLVVIDEAYIEFVRDADAASGCDLLAERPNVCVLRTFSKAFGLAGLRIGYAVAHPAIAAALRKTTTPFAVSAVAQLAAVGSLAAEDELMERVDAVVAGRERIFGALRAQGWSVMPSEANFVWVADDGRADRLVDGCREAGLSVRSFPGEGVRVTVGAPQANEQLIEAAAAAIEPVVRTSTGLPR